MSALLEYALPVIVTLVLGPEDVCQVVPKGAVDVLELLLKTLLVFCWGRGDGS